MQIPLDFHTYGHDFLGRFNVHDNDDDDSSKNGWAPLIGKVSNSWKLDFCSD